MAKTPAAFPEGAVDGRIRPKRATKSIAGSPFPRLIKQTETFWMGSSNGSTSIHSRKNFQRLELPAADSVPQVQNDESEL